MRKISERVSKIHTKLKAYVAIVTILERHSELRETVKVIFTLNKYITIKKPSVGIIDAELLFEK